MRSLEHLFDKVKDVVQETLDENRGRPRKKKPGRDRLSDEKAAQTVLMSLLATVKRWSWSKLHERLTAYHDPYWRDLCGVNLSQIPAYSTMTWRMHRKEFKRMQERVYKRLLSPLLNRDNAALLAVDMTDLPADSQDGLGRWGVCSKGKSFGYKLHLIVTRDGVPLAMVVTKANLTEGSDGVDEELLNKLERRLTEEELDNLVHVVADAAYDSNSVYRDFRDLGADLIAAVNARNDDRLKGELSWQTKRELKERGNLRDLGIIQYHRQRGQELYKEREVVEGVFGQLKEWFIPTEKGSEEKLPWWTRGVRKVKETADRVLFALLSIEYTNKMRGNDLRKISPYKE